MNTTLNLAGQGTIVFNGAIATTNVSAVNTLGVLQPGVSSVAPSTYTLVNNGTMAATRSNSTTSPGATLSDAGQRCDQ
jgi:hypothetical protein